MSLEQFKVLVLDMVSTICAEMAERVRLAEEKASNFFVNRTNVYRAEDGRPICYCCLRVGHVAKYCWDRRYSCHHNREELPVMQGCQVRDFIPRSWEYSGLLGFFSGIFFGEKISGKFSGFSRID